VIDVLTYLVFGIVVLVCLWLIGRALKNDDD
jgi:hypothetical protein